MYDVNPSIYGDSLSLNIVIFDGQTPMLFRITEGTPNKETVSAMLEVERIAKDPTVKGYHDVDEFFADLDA